MYISNKEEKSQEVLGLLFSHLTVSCLSINFVIYLLSLSPSGAYPALIPVFVSLITHYVAGDYHQAQPSAGDCHQAQPTAGDCHQAQPKAGDCYQAQPTSGDCHQAKSTVGDYHQAQPAVRGIFR